MHEDRSLASDAEWADALVLWEKVFEVGPWLFHTLHRGHEDRRLEDCTATFVEGEMVAAVDFFVRQTRDAAGRPRVMGGIGSVATHPEHRKQGHSSRLLDRALEKMEARGCEWSILFTGVPDHYAKKGWRTIPITSFTAVRGPEAPPMPQGMSVEAKPYWGPSEAGALNSFYEASYGSAPLTPIRPELAWRHSVRERMNRPSVTTLIARRGDEMAGYAVVEASEESFSLIEWAGPDGEEALASGLASFLQERGLNQGSLRIPQVQIQSPALARLWSEVKSHEEGWTMARPIAGRMTWEEVEAAFRSPQGCHLKLNDF